MKRSQTTSTLKAIQTYPAGEARLGRSRVFGGGPCLKANTVQLGSRSIRH